MKKILMWALFITFFVRCFSYPSEAAFVESSKFLI
jgi:hypothetical protein